MKTKKTASLVAILILFVQGISAQTKSVIPVTAKQAVDIAFKNVTEIKNARIDYDLQKAKNKEYTSAAYPQINATMGMNHYFSQPTIDFANSNYYLYNDLINQGVKGANGSTIIRPASAVDPSLDFSFVYPWNMNAGVQLNQLLFQPDVFIALKARKRLMAFAESNISIKEDEVKLNVYKTYYAVLIAEKQMIYLRESISRLEKLVHDQTEIFKNGFAERLDIDKTNVSLNNLKATSYQLQNGIDINYMVLKNAMGLKQTDSLALKDTLSTDMVKGDLLANDNFNYDERSEIRMLKRTSDLLKLDVRRNKLSKYPTLALFGQFNSQAQRNSFDFYKDKKWINTTLVGINISLPLYNGSIRKHKLEQAKLNVQKNDNTIERVKEMIDLEQGAAKKTYTNSVLALDVQERNMVLAKKVFETTKKKYEQGLGSSFEILMADSELQQANGNYFKALYDATIARISYLKSVGKL
ncbi:MAG: TolC family protein [Chitinophagaceae bacterium]|nr:TolC family protein [Chitinophagaceae bacterium]